MRVDLFDFHLPVDRIATQPASPRDAAKLLCVGDGPLIDSQVKRLPELLRSGDVMVVNDTKVIPARLFAKRGEARIEILLHKSLSVTSWQVFARPAKKLRAGDVLSFADDFSATVAEKRDDGQVILHFDVDGKEAFYRLLMQHGDIPLPPYIARSEGALESDRDHYQTIYAREEGSVAAPTAGLHFTPTLLEAIRAKGVIIVHITLHVGGGTFLPVKAEDTADHVMHSEWGHVSEEAAGIINAARQKGGRVIAVGTTSLRLLESAADVSGQLAPFLGETDIFITPGYRFKIVDCLMTNFHLPKSTLFMLVAAFCGTQKMQDAYAHAIASDYRFYSYGDACFLEKEPQITVAS